HFAFAVTVEMVFPLLREKFDGADIAAACFERAADREIVHLAVEGRRLAADLAGRMRIGIRYEPVAVEHREPPVHRRIGREPGLDRENLARKIAVAFLDRVEARLRAESREPRRPDMRGHEIGIGMRFECYLEKIARIEAEDRTAVRSDVADPPEPTGDPVHRREIGCVDEVMDLPRLLALLVDRRYLHRELETHGRAARGGELRENRFLDLGLQTKQAGLGGNELLFNFRAPCGMDEIAGADHGNTLSARPPSKMLKIEVAARCARMFGMDMQVSVKPHRRPV